MKGIQKLDLSSNQIEDAKALSFAPMKGITLVLH